MGISFPGTEPSAGCLVWSWAGGGRGQGETSADEISLQIFKEHMCVGNQPTCICASYQPLCGLFFITLVLGLLLC